MIEGCELHEDCRFLLEEIDRREKEDLARLRKNIKEAERVAESLQQEHVRRTGLRHF